MPKQKNAAITLAKEGQESVVMNYLELREAVVVLRAMNHKLRQSIVDVLSGVERMAVTDIFIKLRLEQSVASQHLAILRKANIVYTERQGKFIYYSLNAPRLASIAQLVDRVVSK